MDACDVERDAHDHADDACNDEHAIAHEPDPIFAVAEEKRLQRKKRREAERKARARENEKRRKNDRKGWLEKRVAANKAADAAADAL